ncbi:unnamed protein product [Dibothriocephalus latus]|uniref:ATP receptor n=1 Tax=Dibothriocephalus latus TaxID=60516 RepID=A0A3P7LC49_DIBLA|nr:unnamed protein product [Dibothriocephalus latus]
MPKVVVIKASSVGVIYRLLQLAIFVYFIAWVMFQEKGYQAFERPISGVTARVHGTAFNNQDHEGGYHAGGPIIYTEADLVVPPIQNAGFFLMTRIYSAIEQEQAFCAESPELFDAVCSSDADCPAGEIAGTRLQSTLKDVSFPLFFDIDLDGHGPFTGRCLPETSTCEVYAWCPILENSEVRRSSWSKIIEVTSKSNPLQRPNFHLFTNLKFIEQRGRAVEFPVYKRGEAEPLYDILNFTVSIKNSIEFPIYKFKKRNILPWMNASYLKNCIYEKGHPFNEYCPNFRLHNVIQQSGAVVREILKDGGIIEISINWDCDLDLHADKCSPKYSFRYLGSISESRTNHPFTSGKFIPLEEKFYREIATHYGSTHHKRMLLKVNGIQFIISVTGRAGKFNLLEFSMKVGSSMAFLGTATLLCDMILVYLSKDRYRYRSTISHLSELTRSATFIARYGSGLASGPNKCRTSAVAGRKAKSGTEDVSEPPPKPRMENVIELSQLLHLYTVKQGISTVLSTTEPEPSMQAIRKQNAEEGVGEAQQNTAMMLDSEIELSSPGTNYYSDPPSLGQDLIPSFFAPESLSDAVFMNYGK